MSMLTCPFPVNLNPLSPNGFQFSINKLPEMTYFSQEVALPGIALPTVDINTPFSTMKIAGDLMTYQPLEISFLVDEKMSNYLAIHDWIVAMGFPVNYQQYISWQNKDNTTLISELSKNYSDGVLQILGSNNTPIQTINFIDLIPTGLSSLQLTTTSEDVIYITCTCTFEYSHYTFV